MKTMSDEEMEHWEQTNKLPKRCQRVGTTWLAVGLSGIIFTILTILLW